MERKHLGTLDSYSSLIFILFCPVSHLSTSRLFISLVRFFHVYSLFLRVLGRKSYFELMNRENLYNSLSIQSRYVFMISQFSLLCKLQQKRKKREERELVLKNQWRTFVYVYWFIFHVVFKPHQSSLRKADSFVHSFVKVVDDKMWEFFTFNCL